MFFALSMVVMLLAIAGAILILGSQKAEGRETKD